jgi:two-component system chemotaxis response regulator CheB
MCGAMRSSLSVLVVDDSAVVRQFMTQLLARYSWIRVRVAADPIFARAKIEAEKPDVILLDLEMPRQHGLEFLRDLMARDPIPVVVCSSVAGPGSDAAIRALEEGAVEIVSKPELGVRVFLEENANLLVDKLRAAATARLSVRSGRPASRAPDRNANDTVKVTSDKVIAIGASTGGTEAIQTVLQSLSSQTPPVVITQHMPAGFTRSFANRLNTLCAPYVKEAEDGDRLRAGCCYVAPGNRHLRVRRDGAYYIAELYDGPLVSRHRPSVDVLFESMATQVGASGIGILLTGMGDDGAQGLLQMNSAGAVTIAQDENSCVVFGMPREAIALGAAQHILPLANIGAAIMQCAAQRSIW